MKMSLYETTVEGMELDRILGEAEGELTPELEWRLDTFLKAGKESIDAACKVVQSLEAASNTCYVEAMRLMARKDSYEQNIKSLKARVLGAVDNAFDGKVKSNLFTVWGQTSAPTVGFEVSPDADLAEVQKVFPEVVRTRYELDKTALKSMRAQGKILPAAVTVIENEGTRYLRIK